jgi:DNA-binding response OmpR family regulator
MKTIVCIDDDAWVLDSFREALIPRGYRVLVTTSTTVVPGFLKHEKVDLVLLDLNMPKKHGLKVYQELAASAAVPVLFVTACSRSFFAQRREYEKELDFNRTDLLPKPFTLTQLYQKVEGLIGPGSPSARAANKQTEPVSLLQRLHSVLATKS